MKLNKKKGLLLIGAVVFLVGYFLIRETYSTNDTVSDKYISDNISKLNTILETKIETTNPYYVTEIVDENGNVPAYNYYTHVASRSIKELKAYDNKIFMGLGDWNDNTGPVKIIYYDTVTKKIETSGTIEDEAVQSFTIIDDKLYTTGADPRAGWGYGSYYVYNKENNSWDQYKFNNGWIHVFDIEKFNDKIFMCGSVTAESKKSPIQVSFDNGETFQDTKIMAGEEAIPYDSSLRFYALEEYNNDLYARMYFTSYEGKYSGMYKYDEENNQFNRILSYLPLEQTVYGLNASVNFNYIYLTNNTIFNDYFIFVSGNYMYKVKDLTLLENFEIIKMRTTDVVQDIVVVEDTLYTLSYQYNEDMTFSTRIYSTKDLSNFNLVYEFTIDSMPFSFEYHDNNFYIGTAYNASSKDNSQTGSLYQIELDKFKKYLTLDSDNKTINITKDGITYPINYKLNSNDSVFNTTLTFNNNMSQMDWEQEFSKLENLNLIYTLVDTKKSVNYDSSTSYYNNVLYENIDTSTQDYSTAIEFAEAIFSEELIIEDKRFNITTENISETEDEYKVSVTLTVYNIDDKITSEEYIVNEDDNYIYIGTDNDTEIIKSNIKASELVEVDIDLNSNKLLVKYGEVTLKEYKLISFNTNKKIIDKYIYVSNLTDEEIYSEVDIINGDILVKDNKLQIKYNDTLLEEYTLIRMTSDNLKIINNDKIYISTKTVGEVKENISIINAELLVNDSTVEIVKENTAVAEHEVLSINFGSLKELDKTVIIPEEYSYDEFISNITVSTGITHKVFKDNTEITNGLLEENTTLKIYYGEEEIDTFNIIYEYLEFDSSINVDNENKYLSNINSNTNVNDILDKINTSGTITVTNTKDELLEDNNLISTGTKITVKLMKSTYEYQVIINGDIDGNGVVSLQDVFQIANYVYNDKNSLTGVYKEAADYDDNNEHNLQDIMKTANKIYKEAIK